MTERLGQQLGNYRLIRLLGEGGFAEVYLGEHVYLKTQAAVKVLQVRITNDNLEGFLTEARTIASLKHPHIVRVLDFGVEGSTPFLVMDYASNTGNLLFTYCGHSDTYQGGPNWINSVVWSPDGSHIASGSHDTTVQVCDATNGNQLLTYQGHSLYVNAVAWS